METKQIDVPVEKLFWDLCLIENPTRKRFAVCGEPQKLISEIKRLKMMGCVEISYSGDEWSPDIKAVAINQTGFNDSKQFAVAEEFREKGFYLRGNFTHERIFGSSQ